MKIIKNLFILFFCIALNIHVYGQSQVVYRLPASERAIPKVVLESFKAIHPFVKANAWYATHINYWQNDVSAGWYTDWYGNRTIVVYTYEKPTYYEVEFNESPDELSRSIFNLYGYWYETRTIIKGMPMAIYDALRESEYRDWKISILKEKIEAPGWPNAVFRFKVSKGMKALIIRIDAEGNIVQSRGL